MKVCQDYMGNLIQHRKTQSLYEKTLIGPKRAVFNFFQSSEIPLPPVRTPLIRITLNLDQNDACLNFTKFRKNGKVKQASFWSKLKVILMVVVIIWHRLDNIRSKGNLMLYAMHITVTYKKSHCGIGCNIG